VLEPGRLTTEGAQHCAMRCCLAPVNAPFSWPNNSEAMYCKKIQVFHGPNRLAGGQSITPKGDFMDDNSGMTHRSTVHNCRHGSDDVVPSPGQFGCSADSRRAACSRFLVERAPRADQFEYGSSRSGVLRGAPLDANNGGPRALYKKKSGLQQPISL
jgi:hypothetical protein